MDKQFNGGQLLVNHPVDHWARIDRRILDDHRLSIEARGVLAWAGSRPNGHVLWINNLMNRCGIGKGKWQRIRLELQEYQYLGSERIRNISGRFGWKFVINICFNAPESTTTIARKTGDGSAGDGKYDYIKGKNCIDIKPSHPQPAACAAGFRGKASGCKGKIVVFFYR